MEKERMLREEEIKRYEQYLRLEERAPATIAKYLHDIRVFMEYRGRQAPDLCHVPVSKEEILDFKYHLIGNYQPRSVNSMLAALNSFFTFLGWNDFRVKLIKIQRQMFCEEEKEFSRKEYYRLVRTAIESGKERLALILQTLCGLGLRISELRAVTAEAVRIGKLWILNKGKNRTVFIGRKLQKQLLEYMRRRHIDSGKNLGKPLRGRLTL